MWDIKTNYFLYIFITVLEQFNVRTVIIFQPLQTNFYAPPCPSQHAHRLPGIPVLWCYAKDNYDSHIEQNYNDYKTKWTRFLFLFSTKLYIFADARYRYPVYRYECTVVPPLNEHLERSPLSLCPICNGKNLTNFGLLSGGYKNVS